eukprot:GFUD01007478.1.p1 GENE.GFUD01007478.1~~GFUD01007478.1.p1  ORF type:complete len:458 (+),score=121.80 GFUD01007478.1:36-1409(+)
MEYLGGVYELFLDPPEFKLLQTPRKQILDGVRVLMGVLATLLTIFQTTKKTTSCRFNSQEGDKEWMFGGIGLEHGEEVCGGQVAEGSWLVADSALGWILSLQVLTLMVTTKFIGRPIKIKNICEQFQDLTNKVLTNEDEGSPGEVENLLDPAHLVNTYDGLMKQIKAESSLSDSVVRNSVICGFFSAAFFAIDVTITIKRKALEEEMFCTISNETWTCIFPLSDHTFWVGTLFSCAMGIELLLQIVALFRGKNKSCQFESLYHRQFGGIKEHSDIFYLYSCLAKVHGEENALIVLMTMDKTLRSFWKDEFTFRQETQDHNPYVSLVRRNHPKDKDILRYLTILEGGNCTIYMKITNIDLTKKATLPLARDDKQNVFNFNNPEKAKVLNVDIVWKRRKIFTDIQEFDGQHYISQQRDVSLTSPVRQSEHFPENDRIGLVRQAEAMTSHQHLVQADTQV